MSPAFATDPRLERRIAAVYRDESRRVLATLIRLLGDFDLAEEALHDAFAAALAQWPEEGIPDNPRAWLVSTGRFKAIDQLRRRARFDAAQGEIAERLHGGIATDVFDDEQRIGDDRLRLIFTCCHPGLSMEARIALTLREVCDLTTEEIARAFLTTPATLAQRIVRAKKKIRVAGIPYEVPGAADLPGRLDAVLQVIYLVFNEGYAASAGDTLIRRPLIKEAIRLARLLVELLPDPEAKGLLALMLLHDSRSAARSDANGDLVTLEEQDRSRWNRAQIEEGQALIREAMNCGHCGPYTLQATISALHAGAASAEETDWAEIVGLYELLLRLNPSPVLELNRAVALAMRDGPQVGLSLVDELLTRDELANYHLAHAARADFCRRLGRHAEAAEAYDRALSLCDQAQERRFLKRQQKQCLSPGK